MLQAMKHKRILYFIGMWFYLMIHAQYTYSQSQEKIYSATMLNFARGMEWPHSSQKEFIIGVLAYPPLAAELKLASSNSKVGNRKIVIKEYTSPDEIDGCHMIFVPSFKSKAFNNVLSKTVNDPTLIVCNKTDYASKGAGVNLVLLEGRLRYEINSSSIEKRGIKISSNVKKFGIAVN
jgi:hypothetical protein